ncbi:MAG: N-acetyl-gamma-glutamyl-phosphate reductase [Bacteriovoracaceae bacterium]|nr:N-acetyl-gamma-glutamyl-phosphate reductase [Bacteriovoracaceae bacterium]
MQNLFNSTHKIPVAIVGGRGYSGAELTRLLKHHPQAYVAGSFNSQTANEVLNGTYQTVFLATPAEASLELAPKLLARGMNVIDLSGAFRLPLGDVKAEYLKWYKFEHLETELVAKAHYGLVPWNKLTHSQDPKLIANPGCYASATLLALLPLLNNNVIQNDSIVIDAKSGTTGAGKKADEALLFSEVDGECLPYKIGEHQHLPEINQWAKLLTQETIDPFFTTHLLATRRGIIVSLYAKLEESKTINDVKKAFESAYSQYDLVEFGETKEKHLLQLKKVVGTAKTHISYQVTGTKLHVFSTIDNLLKGAASQAVENFNLLNDLPHSVGLTHLEALS